jgi:hypothetical protein
MSGVNGQPLLSARSTWSRWCRKARATTPRSIHSPRVNRPLREAAGWVAAADLFIADLRKLNLVIAKIVASTRSCQWQNRSFMLQE